MFSSLAEISDGVTRAGGAAAQQRVRDQQLINGAAALYECRENEIQSTFLDQRGVELRLRSPLELVHVHDGVRCAEAGHDDHDACSTSTSVRRGRCFYFTQPSGGLLGNSRKTCEPLDTFSAGTSVSRTPATSNSHEIQSTRRSDAFRYRTECAIHGGTRSDDPVFSFGARKSKTNSSM